MDQSTITFLVLGAAVVVFVSGKVPVGITALGVSLALWATGVLTLEESLAGFGDPTVLFIAGTFVVAEALDATGVTAWVGQQLLARAGEGRARLLTLLIITCALVTALITPNASVAALIPAAVVIAVKARQKSSQILMPMAFGAHAGALLALTGSPVNVLVSDAARDAGVERFGFFEFALAGVPLLIGTLVIGVVVTPKVLPKRDARVMPADFSNLAGELIRDYELDGTMAVYDRERGVAEVVIPPRSALIGEEAFPGMVTDSGDLVVVGIQRNGAALEGDVVLAGGDSLLLRGTWPALDRHLPDDDLVMVAEPGDVRRQVVALGLGAKESLFVLAAMVVLLATGAVPAAVASLLAAVALVLLKVLTAEDAYRAISWTTVVLVAGMIPLSTAMQTTGAAQQLADALVDVVGDAGPTALIAGLFLLTVVMGQLISNTATALIVIPIAVTSAAELDVSARPVLMAVNVAATAALLTPVATPANMMVMEPGGYAFSDYWKLGLPVLAWYAVVALGLVPLIWRF